MAKMISQAGEMTVALKEVTCEDDNLLLVGQMGVWDSRILVSPDEALTIMRLMLRPRILAFMVKAPFYKLLHRSRKIGTAG